MGSLGVLGFSWFLAVIPGDDPESGWLNAIRAPLFDGRTHPVTQRPTSPFARRLVLPDQVFLTEAERKTWAETPEDRRGQIARTRVLRGRDLRFAELDRADLRGADLTGAFLQGAVLRAAKMQGADLSRTQMQGARLDGAQMQGAMLAGAWMQGADLREAQMQGANLDGAQMQGADLREAQMQGASLTAAGMQGADLREAQMQGAQLFLAQMQGAVLLRAQIQGADLEGARMQGADLSRAQAWRMQARGAVTSEAVLNAVAFGDEPRCEERARHDGSCRRAVTWHQAVEAWLAEIPTGARREAARQRLAVLLEPRDLPQAERAAASWPQTIPRAPGRVADLLGGLACGGEHAPHMARSVFAQIELPPPDGRDLGPHRATLAARMLGGDCPGAQALPPYERAELARIAAGQD
jgi:uncharacterized protein YjbI with pentapeptide repeats